MRRAWPILMIFVGTGCSTCTPATFMDRVFKARDACVIEQPTSAQVPYAAAPAPLEEPGMAFAPPAIPATPEECSQFQMAPPPEKKPHPLLRPFQWMHRNPR